MKKKILIRILCFISGVLTGVCLLFPDFGPLIFCSAVFGILTIRREQTPEGAALLCTIFSLGICMTGYLPAFSIKTGFNTNTTFLIDLAVYAAICIIHAAMLSAALFCGARLPSPRWLRFACISAFWTFGEWILGVGVFAWPTLRLGLALWKYPFLMQSAKLGGQLFVSFIIVATNALLAEFFISLRRRNFFVPLAAFIAALTTIAATGTLLINDIPTDTKIAVIQPGVTVIGDERDEVYDIALSLTEKAAKNNPDIIFLPESIIPSSFPGNKKIKKEWNKIAKESGTDIFVGGRSDGHAAVFYFSDDEGSPFSHQKQREVPFFENGFGEREFRWIPNNETGLFSADNANVGTMICYESMFSSMSYHAAKNDADILAVLTNDSWFDSDIAKNIHLAHSIYRAVETGRTLVQSGLNGNTAVINQNGVITDKIPSGGKDILYAAISTETQDTPYMLFREYWLFTIVFVFGAITIAKKNTRHSV